LYFKVKFTWFYFIGGGLYFEALAQRRCSDENTYTAEIATNKQYRFYGYWEPEGFQDNNWQAKNMAKILPLLNRELGVCEKPEYFGGCW
jgi:hypothetical protein